MPDLELTDERISSYTQAAHVQRIAHDTVVELRAEMRKATTTALKLTLSRALVQAMSAFEAARVAALACRGRRHASQIAAGNGNGGPGGPIAARGRRRAEPVDAPAPVPRTAGAPAIANFEVRSAADSAGASQPADPSAPAPPAA